MSDPDRISALEANLKKQFYALDSDLTARTFRSADICADALPLRDSAAELAELYRKQLLAGTNPKLLALLKTRSAPQLVPSSDVAQVLFGAATQEQLNSCYTAQIRAEAAAARGLINQDKAVQGLWMYWGDWEGGGTEGLPFFRAEAIRNVLNDLIKYCDLLARTDTPTLLTACPATFVDDFKTLRPEWQPYGSPQLAVTAGNLTIQGEACTVWLAQDFENAVVAFDYTPLTLADRAGALFAFPGKPLPGYTWADSAGSMDLYNTRIETYHASLCRGNSGMTNLRRTGTGLRMLSTVQPDPCAELGKTYRIELLTWKGVAQVYVDGKLTHAYPDVGVYGPVLHKGRFGLRLFAGGVMSMRISHFSIKPLSP